MNSIEFAESVFGCDSCPASHGFSRPAPARPYFKFPPIIGAPGQVQLLFIGINPRLSKSNRDLHVGLMNSREAYLQLAANREPSGKPYISLTGKERHYHSHMLVVEGVFGTASTFESVAAVTELFFCATLGAPKALSEGPSACAVKHLKQVFEIAKPKVVIAVGSMVQNHLGEFFPYLRPVVSMKHPAPDWKQSLAAKRAVVERLPDRQCNPWRWREYSYSSLRIMR